MFGSLEAIVINYGYFGLFLASFFASTILPFGSEGLVLLLIYEKFNFWVVVLVASSGNFLGACTSYYIGWKGRNFVEKYLKIDPKDIEKADKYFSRYGSFLLLFTWLPLIGDVFTVVGGLLRLKFWIFSVFVFTGKFLRYLAVAYLAGVFL
ncbi:MAG: DedA family protein [Candidatus Methanoperedens sp.]|nr:DedA family protein [Candidatus Methanoperedens sp.]MCE8424995.1 DedA family protein [Candidatus Methanoperedens sp.]MCE8427429.1 DedA family protein [Candidatus Methanoperedens sp.]